MQNVPYIKAVRYSKNADEILKRRPTAFLLLYLIAQRARRTNESNFDDLEIGEAKIGDYKSYGASEQVYRDDKKFLEKFQFATFRGTSKGTIAKLIDTSIFDINPEQTNEQETEQTTDKERAENGQGTTNNNVKKVKKEKKVKNNKITPPDNSEENSKSKISVLEDPEFRRTLQERFPDAPISLEIRTMQDWLKANGRRYKDYEAFAKNWLRKKWKEKLPQKLAEPITTQFDVEFMNAKNDFTGFYAKQNHDRLEGNIMKAAGEVMMHVQKLGREQWMELYKQTKRLGIHFYKFVTFKVTQENMSYNQAVKAWDQQQ